MMKTFIFSLIFLILSTMSFAQRGFKVTINNVNHFISERDLDECFASAFNDIVMYNVTSDSNFTLWKNTYASWKDYVDDYDIIYETMGNRLSNHSNTISLPYAYAGLKPNGRPATGNPHKKDNTARRMSIINYYLPYHVIYKLTGKRVKQ